jgi:hypothetical protein
MEDLVMFSAGSANDHLYKHLWLKGASLFIPQLNMLLRHTNYFFNIISIETFMNDCDDLGRILALNGSDKSTSHNYHIAYSHILKKLGVDSCLNILEIGLGTNNPRLVSTMGPGARPGASLYAFRDFLPYSNIFGADIDKNILFEHDRIRTTFVDQLDLNSFDVLSTAFGNRKYDLIIDDGLHSIGANFNTLLFALDKINDNGWIVIEDIHVIDNWKAIDFILQSTKKYKTYLVKAKVSHIYMVHKLP